MGWRNAALSKLEDIERECKRLRDELESPERHPWIVGALALEVAGHAIECSGEALEEAGASHNAGRSLELALGYVRGVSLEARGLRKHLA